MQYRTLGSTGLEVSVLGFGCMRLPLVSKSTSPAHIFDANQPIDEDHAMRMIRYALDAGINYFDTAYPYHGGQSETFLGRALAGKRRDVLIATKMPVWLVDSRDDAERIFREQLERLQTDYVDIYLLHSLNRSYWDKVKKLDLMGFLDRLIVEGRARHVGFSFHDTASVFKKIVDGYDWSMAQIQYNYFDEHYQAGREGLEYAAARGIGVVIMEPLRGGKLAARIPNAVRRLWDEAETRRSPAEWALRWVWHHPRVSTVLSGMSSFKQVEENVAAAADPNYSVLSDEELELISRVAGVYRAKIKVDCTGCGYCMPCPEGVDIPLNLSLYNDVFIFDDLETSKTIYKTFVGSQQKASNCAECGECEEKCPQQLDIKAILEDVDHLLS